VYLTTDNKLLSQWTKKSVSIEEVKFDTDEYQIYYYNFGDNHTAKEVEQKRKAAEIREAEQKKAEELKLTHAASKAKNIISQIKSLHIIKSQVFKSVLYDINELDDFEISVLNTVLDFNNREKHKIPPLLQYIYKANQEDVAFIDFILSCPQIKMDINEKDSNGKSAVQYVYENNRINQRAIVKALLRSGYEFIESDKKFLNSLHDPDFEKSKELLLYSICNNLKNRQLVDSAFDHYTLLFIIESIKQKKIIGFNWKSHEWIAFVNNAIQYHSEYWEYIEVAFKAYGIWDILLQSDKKGTFHKKLKHFYTIYPQQLFDFDEVFNDLYPDISSYAADQDLLFTL
jgi:hypothetical protein